MLRFLNAGLINVGGDDAKLEKLRETAVYLAEALKNAPSKAPSFALIAFDPDAPAEDPVIKEAVDALQKRWATYVNTFSGTPVFVTSARNALPFKEAGNERAIWAEVIGDIERRVDARAEAEWATPETINVPTITFQPPAAIQVSISQTSIDQAALAKKFEAAAGPQSPKGPTGGNPHWPQNQANWVGEFGTRLAVAVTEALDAVAKGSEIKPIDLSDPLKGLANSVSAHVDETLKAVSTATAGLERRTNLIWWKQTLYSPSARVSYRAMPAYVAAALMAFDLHRQVPTFSPASVAAFLHEAVLSLPSLKLDESRPIRDLVTEASSADEIAPLRQAAAELVPKPIGRGPLLGLIGHGTGESKLDDRAFRALVGVPAATGLRVPEWATWLFRELQAARAAQEGTAEKKRGRKN
jgi:hypothetical protein